MADTKDMIVEEAPVTALESPEASSAITNLTACEDDAVHAQATPTPYTILSEPQKKFLILVAAFAAAISPFSTSTYYPSVGSIARDLKVSVSKINLTISTYQIFQGLAPTFVAALADAHGRRPAFLLCFVVYFAANIGLALQSDYAALLVLRCVQSAGSGGTVALAQAVVADIATRAERGRYLAYGIIGTAVGPAMGPVVGGLLTHFLGWHSIFWFLLILGTVMFLIIATFFPETARSIVGNGSIAPPPWNKPLIEIFPGRRKQQPCTPDLGSLETKRINGNPLGSLTLLRNRENFILCISGGLFFAGTASVTSVFASQLEQRFHYNAVQSGLCYLPIAFGSLTSGLTTSRLIDWNFRREAHKQGLNIVKGQQQDITHFDTEKARLAVALPMMIFACTLMIAYGWQMQYRAPLATILITLMCLSNVQAGTMVSNVTLLNDLNHKGSATVGAAVNLTRCLLSAGGIAVVGPFINAVGIGWTSTVTAAIWLIFGWGGFLLVYLNGFSWRRAMAQRNPPVAVPDTSRDAVQLEGGIVPISQIHVQHGSQKYPAA